MDANTFLGLGFGGAGTAGNPPLTPQQSQMYNALAGQLMKQQQPGASVGPYQSYGPWNALAQTAQGGMAGLLANRARMGQLQNIQQGAGAVPSFGNPGPQQPMIANPSAGAATLGSPAGIAGVGSAAPTAGGGLPMGITPGMLGMGFGG
jgi:hypothetical protein